MDTGDSYSCQVVLLDLKEMLAGPFVYNCCFMFLGVVTNFLSLFNELIRCVSWRDKLDGLWDKEG